MSPTVCYLESDASSARLISGDADRTWQADPPAEGDEQAQSAESARRNVQEAASWASEQIGSRKRIDVVCIGVDESLCTWLSAPSADRQVVTAAIRRRQQDWGDSYGASLIQPLAQEESSTASKSTIGRLLEKRRRGTGAEKKAKSRHMAVLQVQDGAARLWLDELDARGVRIGAVTTLWHAMARAWARPASPTSNGDSGGAHQEPTPENLAEQRVSASVLVEDEGRLTWAWSIGGRLLAAGRVSIPQGERAARVPDAGPESHATISPMRASCARLTLDWLTWSAQLGRRPDEIVIVGHHASDAADEIRRAWSASETRLVEEDDPIAATLRALSGDERAARLAPSDPRQSVVDLSCRPARSLRRLFLFSAAAIVLLAIGVGALGFQFAGWAGELASERRARSSELAEQMRALGVSARPGLEVRAMESQLATLRQETTDVVEPPDPYPVLDELVRLAEQLQAIREEEGAKVERIRIDDAQATATVRMTEFAPLEQLRASLTESEGYIRWRGRINGSPPNVSLQLTGTWETDQ